MVPSVRFASGVYVQASSTPRSVTHTPHMLPASSPMMYAPRRIIPAPTSVQLSSSHGAQQLIDHSARVDHFPVLQPMREVAVRVLSAEEVAAMHAANFVDMKAKTGRGCVTPDTVSLEEDVITHTLSDVETVTLEERSPPPTSVAAESLQEVAVSEVAAPETRSSDDVAVEDRESANVSQVNQVAVVGCFDCSRGALRALFSKSFGKSYFEILI